MFNFLHNQTVGAKPIIRFVISGYKEFAKENNLKVIISSIIRKRYRPFTDGINKAELREFRYDFIYPQDFKGGLMELLIQLFKVEIYYDQTLDGLLGTEHMNSSLHMAIKALEKSDIPKEHKYGIYASETIVAKGYYLEESDHDWYSMLYSRSDLDKYQENVDEEMQKVRDYKNELKYKRRREIREKNNENS